MRTGSSRIDHCRAGTGPVGGERVELKDVLAGVQSFPCHLFQQRELIGVKELYAKNLVQLPRLTQLERETARIEGERGQLTAAMAQSRLV